MVTTERMDVFPREGDRKKGEGGQGERERERNLGYLRLGTEQVLFKSNQSTFQVFVGFLWVHPLTNLSPFQARQTGLVGSCCACLIEAPLLVPF